MTNYRDGQHKPRLIALHLPQYHPIAENNRWWGEGFTEWTNVVKAKPLYRGHYQPQLPADLGFYDLRLAEARQAQAALAKHHGIHGFCYYHYWFNGKRLLERPVDEILTSGEPDFPFMLCWANEHWTRRWDGSNDEILMAQEYSVDDDVAHMHHLVRYFQDPRYIRIDNKPIFILYKPHLLPNATDTATRWRSVAASYGLELYLCHMVFGYRDDTKDLIEGFDAAIDFEPFGVRRRNFFEELVLGKRSRTEKALMVIKNRLGLATDGSRAGLNLVPYTWMYQNLKPLGAFGYKLFPSIVPGWDNTARRSKDPSLILDGATPDRFRNWLKEVKKDFKFYSEEENLIFVNAWNEWAEGNHLEPCLKWGNDFLEALKEISDES